jgi:hypothetical protein
MERRRDRRLRADFAIFQHKADGILCHADGFVHGIALGEAALNIGNLNRVPGFFRVKNCGIENSVHNVISPFIIQQTINVPSLNRPTLLVGNCRIVYAVLRSFRI